MMKSFRKFPIFIGVVLICTFLSSCSSSILETESDSLCLPDVEWGSSIDDTLAAFNTTREELGQDFYANGNSGSGYAILKGKTVHPDVSLVIAPGSKQVLTMLAQNGALADMVAAGARILESACGPCIGMGQSPKTDAISLRTFNRNFEGRSGTKDAQVYLVSPEIAAASALTGHITDPTTL